MATNKAAGVMKRILQIAKPAILMVLVQATFAGVYLFYNFPANGGMSMWVLVAYRMLFAAAFTVPVALVTEIRESAPKITWKVMLGASLCGLFAVVYQYAYVVSLEETSATLLSAMTSLTPAAAFMLALIFRQETLDPASVGGKAKVVGTLIGISGAMVMTFYRGTEIPKWSTNINLGHHHLSSQGISVLGVVLALGCCLSSATSMTIQADLSNRYPYPYTSTALTNLMAAGISAVFALSVEKDSSQWKLGPDVKLLTVLYSGILASGVAMTLITWCMKLKGPMFVSAFSPLVPIFVAIAGTLALDERLHLGSIVGAVLIGCGLFMVMWGKGREATDAANPIDTLENPITETIEVPVVHDSTASWPPSLIETLELSDMETIDVVLGYDSTGVSPPIRMETLEHSVNTETPVSYKTMV